MALAIGYDSAAPPEVPGHAPFVLPYLDGEWKWSAAELARFAGRPMATITVTGDPEAIVFDYEDGCCTIPELAHGLDARRRKHLPSVVYCSLSQWAPCIEKLAEYGLRRSPSYWWIAQYDAEPGTTPVPSVAPATLPTYGKRYRAVGHQFWSGPNFGPGCFDLSVIDLERWPVYAVGKRLYFAKGA